MKSPDLRTRLRELDGLEDSLGEDFYQRLHDRIMAQVEKVPWPQVDPKPKPSEGTQPQPKNEESQRKSKSARMAMSRLTMAPV